MAALDRAGIRGLVDVDGGFGDALSREIERIQTPYPGRVAVFAQMDVAGFATEPRFGVVEAERLADSVRRGARGLKVWKTVGLHQVDPDGRLIPLDDVRLAPVWEAAAGFDIPVLIHVADPPAFFAPADRNNERQAELRRHPEWRYTPLRTSPDGPGFPSHAELIDQFDRLIQRHPRTTFIGAHLASLGEDLDRLGAMLAGAPNLFVDIAARINELGRRPAAARALFERFQDRVLFATDAGPNPRWYPIYHRFLETGLPNLRYSPHLRPLQGDFRVEGLALPDGVLKKIYADNALRLIRFDG